MNLAEKCVITDPFRAHTVTNCSSLRDMNSFFGKTLKEAGKGVDNMLEEMIKDIKLLT